MAQNHSHRRHKSHKNVQAAAIAEEHKKFIQDAAAAAKLSEMESGVPASITIAQAILESGWGKHHAGAANNYFGVKAQNTSQGVFYGDIATGYQEKKTKEHFHGKDIFINDYFRKYDGMSGSFRDHGSFLKDNKRYKSALDAYAKTGDAKAFAQGLQEAGYATDPNYTELLVKIMDHNRLYQYNKPVDKEEISSSKTSSPKQESISVGPLP